MPDEDYLRELNEAYHHFFFHYTATSLLVVEGSEFRPQDDDEALDDLVKQIKTMGRGTRITSRAPARHPHTHLRTPRTQAPVDSPSGLP